MTWVWDSYAENSCAFYWSVPNAGRLISWITREKGPQSEGDSRKSIPVAAKPHGLAIHAYLFMTDPSNLDQAEAHEKRSHRDTVFALIEF